MEVTAEMARDVRARGLPAMNEALAKLGMVARLESNLGYGPDGVTGKITFFPLAKGQDPSAALLAKAKVEYEHAASYMGLPADSFGKVVMSGGKPYKIVGLVGPRSAKIHVARQPDGKVFVMNATSLTRLLKPASTAPAP
jgi:hypothetical protein